MPIDPIKIPQNVYIEDRIVGPLTLKQIIIVAIGGGFSYMLWATLAQAYGTLDIVTTVLVWIPCAVSMIFAFIKINDLTMFRICLLMLERFNKPALRTWTPRRGLTINFRTFAAPDATAALQAHAPAKNAGHIESLSSTLDSMDEKAVTAAVAPVVIAETPAVAPVQEQTVEETEIPVKTSKEEVADTPATPRPVIRERITADPLNPDAAVDGIAPRARSSLFSA